MDWQATEFNTAWRYAFMGLVRKDPRFQDSAAIKESIAAWTRCVQIVNTQLQQTGHGLPVASFRWRILSLAYRCIAGK